MLMAETAPARRPKPDAPLDRVLRGAASLLNLETMMSRVRMVFRQRGRAGRLACPLVTSVSSTVLSPASRVVEWRRTSNMLSWPKTMDFAATRISRLGFFAVFFNSRLHPKYELSLSVEPYDIGVNSIGGILSR